MALHLGLCGAAAGLLLMVAIVLLRDRPAETASRLGAALTCTGAASAILAAPGFPSEWRWWSLPLVALAESGPVVFWLWARATFNDDFVLRPRHGGLWAAIVGLRLLVFCGGVSGHAASAIDRIVDLVNLVLALLAVAQTLATWRMDLIAGRRRLRVAVLIGTLVFIATEAAANLSGIAIIAYGTSIRQLARAIGLGLLAIVAALNFFRASGPAPALSPAPASAFGDRDRIALIGSDARAEVDPALLRRLERLMTTERVYRREGLTIGSLAAMVSLPEYRLRQVINEGLGHRNFNAFLNRYRIDEAKAALADPGQKDVPVLTIAMDSGFQSIGPFNRAFKTDTGLTPTEFRRVALAEAPSKPLSEARNFEIGEPR
jgi:AraC-like DNA-binding protein